MYFYWPYKDVPEWLERLDYSDRLANLNLLFYHINFGIIINVCGFYLVYPFIGLNFCKLCNGVKVTISGGGNGVIFCPSFLGFITLFDAIRKGHRPVFNNKGYK